MGTKRQSILNKIIFLSSIMVLLISINAMAQERNQSDQVINSTETEVEESESTTTSDAEPMLRPQPCLSIGRCY